MPRAARLAILVALGLAALAGSGFAAEPEGIPHEEALRADYSQWKLALAGGQLADPVEIAARPGFVVEVVRAAAPGEGSWISLAFDGRRLLIGREDRGILRLSFDERQDKVTQVETVNETLLEPRGLLTAHGALFVTANNARGVYRLRDTDADGRYDEETLLRKLDGGVGHGRNGLALGPDGKLYLACGNNVRVPADLAPASPYRNYDLDRLLPCAWNEFLFDSDVVPPAGFVARMDADGGNFELVAGGFRNPYDLAFNAEGELFTYDADMEWDAGAPWYRPTCVMHVVPGGEYGWRQGTSVWPDHFPDALPRVCDVGLGSPTGVAFGTSSKFPRPYREALFILDWAYGRILAIHTTPRGASYTGRVETFLKGKPLNVTDVAFGPDGWMYFTVGGRGTRAALYRVRHAGPAAKDEPPAPADPDSPAAAIAARARQERRALEQIGPLENADAFDRSLLGLYLASTDPFLRHAARLALERQAPQLWLRRVDAVADPRGTAQALLAVARRGEPDLRAGLYAGLVALLGQPLEEQVRLDALRACQLALLRVPPESAERARLRAAVEQVRPRNWGERQLLMELLVGLESSQAPASILAWLAECQDDRQRMFALFALRNVTQGWTAELRRRQLAALLRSERFAGAHYFPRFLTYIRTDSLATFADDERRAHAAEIALLGRAQEPATSAAARPLVKAWQLDELLAAIGEQKEPPDAARGRALLAAALCLRCHRFGTQGAPLGPDLTDVAARFSRRDILDAVLHPSRVVDDKHRAITLHTTDGRAVTGYLVGGDARRLFFAPDPLQLARFVTVERASIARREASPVSPMPEGLFNVFTAAEIRDLLAALEAGPPPEPSAPRDAAAEAAPP